MAWPWPDWFKRSHGQPIGELPDNRSEWQTQCPLSLIDDRSVALVKAVQAIDGGQLTIGWSEADLVPEIVWQAADYVHALQRQQQEEEAREHGPDPR